MYVICVPKHSNYIARNKRTMFLMIITILLVGHHRSGDLQMRARVWFGELDQCDPVQKNLAHKSTSKTTEAKNVDPKPKITSKWE